VKERSGTEGGETTLSLDSAVKELRTIFIEGTAQRVAKMEAMLARLQSGASPNDLKELRAQFHSMAGTGETYGFPAISRIGGTCERECVEVLAGRVPLPAMLASWSRALREVRDALAAPTPPPPPKAPAPPRPPSGVVMRMLVCADPSSALVGPAPGELRDVALTEIASPQALEAALGEGPLGALVLVPGGAFSEAGSVLTTVRSHPQAERASIVVLLDHVSVVERIELMQLGATRVLSRDVSWPVLARIAAAHQGAEAGQGKRVMVLEHDRDLSADLSADLELRGCEVEVFSSLPGLLAGWQEQAADLLLLGRDADGAVCWNVLETIRKRDRRHILPVLVLLANPTPEDRRRTFEAGADDYVVLPYLPEELAARVQTRLELRAATRRLGTFAARPAPAPAPAVKEAARRAGPPRLLLADEDHLVARLLEPRLRQEGWSVTRANDGEQAEKLIAGGGFDLLLLDLHMPFRSGFDLLQWMAQRGLKHRTKVVVLSAVNREEVVLQAFSLKADDFIAKPFNPEIVVTRLRRLLAA
jgi:DNA-binding response OmpR family regulator